MFIVLALWKAEICHEDGHEFQDSLGYRKRLYPEKQSPIKIKAVSANAVSSSSLFSINTMHKKPKRLLIKVCPVLSSHSLRPFYHSFYLYSGI